MRLTIAALVIVLGLAWAAWWYFVSAMAARTGAPDWMLETWSIAGLGLLPIGGGIFYLLT